MLPGGRLAPYKDRSESIHLLAAANMKLSLAAQAGGRCGGGGGRGKEGESEMGRYLVDRDVRPLPTTPVPHCHSSSRDRSSNTHISLFNIAACLVLPQSVEMLLNYYEEEDWEYSNFKRLGISAPANAVILDSPAKMRSLQVLNASHRAI